VSFRCGTCGSNIARDVAACPSCGFLFGPSPARGAPEPSEGALTGTGHLVAWALLVLAVPAFLESAFEMYGLTLVRGPQMLFYSIVHSADPFLLTLLFVSWVCFALLTLYSGCIAILRLFSARSCKGSFGRIFTVVFTIALVHTFLLATYDHWSRLV